MSTPFAAELERPDETSQDFRPLLVADMRFCQTHEPIKAGSGEALDSPAAPFARFTAKQSYPLTGDGAVITASLVSDTNTITGQGPDHQPYMDDSHMDDA